MMRICDRVYDAADTLPSAPSKFLDPPMVSAERSLLGQASVTMQYNQQPCSYSIFYNIGSVAKRCPAGGPQVGYAQTTEKCYIR